MSKNKIKFLWVQYDDAPRQNPLIPPKAVLLMNGCQSHIKLLLENVKFILQRELAEVVLRISLLDFWIN